MPELPEVQTTVDGINAVAKGLRITGAWTSYRSAFHAGKDNIADPKYFSRFKKAVAGATITGATRRAKNVLVHLSNGKTVLIHMKMTGHVLYGRYQKKRNTWIAADTGPLRDDPFNRHIRLVFTLANGSHLVLSDLRKFAKVTLLDTHTLLESAHLSKSGPEPLDHSFTYDRFVERLSMKPKGKIKLVLMDHSVIAGIGNIYSDEMLWKAGIHPTEPVAKVPAAKMKTLFQAMKETLREGIGFGGDSMSDYRNIFGEAGKFQHSHNAYRKTGKKCGKRGCGGTIRRIVLGGRSGHYCDKHQKLSGRNP